MTITNRRDAGYTIISRFEEEFRYFLENKLNITSTNPLEDVPVGIVSKAKERILDKDFEDISQVFENIDFPDLKEICLYKNNYKNLLEEKIDKHDFINYMDELYTLRCKIAHVKGYFTSIDLDKLLELTNKIAVPLNFSELKSLLHQIMTDPQSVIIKIPADFVQDFLLQNGIINNIPIPDYEYEGGFVGRDDDRKKIRELLKNEKFSVITLLGSGGVGKTALALKIIQDLTEKPEEKIFDAIVWLSAKENRLSALGIEEIEPTLKNYEELLDTIIDLFGFRGELYIEDLSSKESLVNLIFELTDRLLLVVDNLETITDSRIINFIFDAPMKVKFLITSRRGIGQVERKHELKELKVREAVYLFRQVARDKQLLSLSNLPEETIKNYVNKVSNYPLAIKWVIGQVARGKDINKVIDSIYETDSDISKFCYDQIFSTLSNNCKKIMYALSLIDYSPTYSILQYTVELEEHVFEDTIEELLLVSLILPEEFINESKEIAKRFSLLPLTKGYTRLQLNREIELREYLINRINTVESAVTTSEKAKKEYKHSLYNFGAKTDEEKVATIICQTAFQKYQLGNYDAAVEEYKKAIKIAPNFAPIYRNWAIMESYEDHTAEAENLMAKAAQLNSNDPQIFLIWGNIYRKNSKHVDANRKYEIAHKLAPEDPIILNALGQSKSRLGEFHEADKYLNQAMNPNDESFASVKHDIISRTSIAENLINWGDYLNKDRDFDNAELKYNLAVEHCLVILEKNVRDPKIYATLSRANLRRGNLYFTLTKDKKAIESLLSVANAHSHSFKQSIYKYNALIILCEYYYYRNKIYNAKKFLELINIEFKNSAILKRAEYRLLNDKYIKLRENLTNGKNVNGKIRNVNLQKQFVIIESTESEKTYLGHRTKFLPPLELVSDDLTGQFVNFRPEEFMENNLRKAVAVNIRLIGI